jgi:hypothetical protein
MTKLNRMILTFVCLLLFAGLTAAKCGDDGGDSSQNEGSDADSDGDSDSDSDSDSDDDDDNDSQSDSVKKKNDTKDEEEKTEEEVDTGEDTGSEAADSDEPTYAALGEGCFLLSSGTCKKSADNCKWGTPPTTGIWSMTKMLGTLMGGGGAAIQTECEPELTCCINEGFCEVDVQELFSMTSFLGGGVTTWSCQDSECTESATVLGMAVDGFQSGCKNNGWCCPHKEVAGADTDEPSTDESSTDESSTDE